MRSSYAVLRNLTKHGIDVVVADSRRIGMCQWSKYPSAKYTYTSHYENEEGFIEDILEICKKERIDVVFPSHNETEILAKYSERFSASQKSLFPDYKTCELFNNKALSYDHASKSSVPVPFRYEYTSLNELSLVLDNDRKSNKYVLKTLTGNSAKGVFYAESKSSTIKLAEEVIAKYKLPQSRFPQIEEYVAGDGWGCSCFYWHGTKITSFTHRRLREKTATGGTSTFRGMEVNELLEQYTKQILDSINWHGFAMVEFKVNPKSGQVWFIEVNPRLWGSFPMAVNAGMEFPHFAILCTEKGSDIALSHIKGIKIRNGFKSKWLLGELLLLISSLCKLDFRNTYRILKDKCDSYDDFYLDDIQAFIGQIMCYLISSLKNFSFNPEVKGMLK